MHSNVYRLLQELKRNNCTNSNLIMWIISARRRPSSWLLSDITTIPSFHIRPDSSFTITLHPSNGPKAHIGLWPPLLRFCNSSFLWCGVVSPTPNPPTWRTSSPYLWPPETGWPSYTPGHWVARVPRGCHSPYPLLWAPEGHYYPTAYNSTLNNLISWFSIIK
jgi:hypothetical protein